MKPKLLLRIAAGLMLFHLAGHSIGQCTWKQATDPVKQAVISQMTDHRFPFMGSIRSMGDYYEGFSYASSIALLLLAVMLWLISGALTNSGSLAYKMTVTITIALFVWSIDEFFYFFPFAACNTLLAALFTLAAVIQLKKQVAP
ncbi:hypothetical protein CLV51_10473 [Chitinophaga niastensis]|uniref:DoxX-like protein n=1 Tax=Chitinophaga niastensis TaxID=536980 RepID=A0A2P8HGN3_CHINA|nr:hypothetical protein [Chitinophaga niastensis]PSL45371.1 hypothetical protein CLV51_10473 [Chitinophaga niastensis]